MVGGGVIGHIRDEILPIKGIRLGALIHIRFLYTGLKATTVSIITICDDGNSLMNQK
jgi:hypothetical protein